MNIFHIAFLNRKRSDGILTVLNHLVNEQFKLGHNVYVLNLNIKEIEKNDVDIIVKSYKQFKRVVNNKKPDIVVFHILYCLPCYLFAFYLWRKKIPYAIQPHGGTMLSSQHEKKWKKVMANFIFVNQFIKKANSLIYLNEGEYNECIFRRKIKRSVFIPNGTNMIKMKSIPHDSIRFIYLSRIYVHPKGLDTFFSGWNKFLENNIGDDRKIEFHIYGDFYSENDRYIFDKLLSECKGNVYYHGIVLGTDKDYAFRNADIFVLPSRHEAMPMSVLEALSYGLPCLITQQTNMGNIIEKENCGWILTLDDEDISNLISRVIEEYKSNRNILKKNAVNAAKKFLWSSVAEESINSYKNIIR